MSAFSRSSGLDRAIAELGAGSAGRLATASAVDELLDESSTELAAAFALEATAYELDAEGQVVRSPWRFAVANAGSALQSLHESEAAIEVASSIAGVTMAPSNASYLYFRDAGDFIGFHTDIPSCEVVLLVGISEESAELVVYPQFERGDPAELLELSRSSHGAPAGGQAMPVAGGEVVALVGRRVPHQTPGAGRRGVVVQASLCYVGAGE